MNRKVDILKSAGVLINDRKFLVTRSKGQDIFIAPGGKIDGSETSEQALIRELEEELTIEVSEDKLRHLGTFFATAAGQLNKHLQMEVYFVDDWLGTISINNEVEEFQWINSETAKDVKLGSIFKHNVLPLLREKNLID